MWSEGRTFTEMCHGSEAGSYNGSLTFTPLNSRHETNNERNEEEESNLAGGRVQGLACGVGGVRGTVHGPCLEPFCKATAGRKDLTLGSTVIKKKWDHRIREPGLYSGQKLTNLYRTPSMSTDKESVQEEGDGPGRRRGPPPSRPCSGPRDSKRLLLLL